MRRGDSTQPHRIQRWCDVKPMGQKGEPDPIKMEAEEGMTRLRMYLDLRDQFNDYCQSHPRPDDQADDPAPD